MPDPTAVQEYSLRIACYTPEVKRFLNEHPGVLGVHTGDEAAPSFPMKKGYLPSFIVCQVLPTLLQHLSHYKDEDIVHITAGLFSAIKEPDYTSLESKRTKEETIKALKLMIASLE